MLSQRQTQAGGAGKDGESMFSFIRGCAALLAGLSFSFASQAGNPEACITHLVIPTSTTLYDLRVSQLVEKLNTFQTAVANGDLSTKFLQNQLHETLFLLQPMRDNALTDTDLAQVESLFASPTLKSHPQLARFLAEIATTGVAYLNILTPSKKYTIQTHTHRLLLQRIFLAAFTLTLSKIEAGPTDDTGNLPRNRVTERLPEFTEPRLFQTLKYLNRATLARIFQTPSDSKPWILQKVDEEWLTQTDAGLQIPGRLEFTTVLSLQSWGLLTQNALLNVLEAVQPELVTPLSADGPRTLKPSASLLAKKKFITQEAPFLMAALKAMLLKSPQGTSHSEWNPALLENTLKNWQFTHTNALTREDLKFLLESLSLDTSTKSDALTLPEVRADLVASVWILSFQIWERATPANERLRSPFTLSIPAHALPVISAYLVGKFQNAQESAAEVLIQIHAREQDENLSSQPLIAYPQYETLVQGLVPYMELSLRTKVEAEVAYKLREWLTQHILILKKYAESSERSDDPVGHAQWEKQIEKCKALLNFVTEYARNAPISLTPADATAAQSAEEAEDEDPEIAALLRSFAGQKPN